MPDYEADNFYPSSGNGMGLVTGVEGAYSYPTEDYAILPGYVTLGYAEGGSPDQESGSWDDVQSAAYSFGTLEHLVTDPSTGGFVGLANRNPYTAHGPVEANTVEDFELRGQWFKVRRDVDDHSGPVGYSDYSGYLAAALASDAYPAISDDAAQYSIALGI